MTIARPIVSDFIAFVVLLSLSFSPHFLSLLRYRFIAFSLSFFRPLARHILYPFAPSALYCYLLLSPSLLVISSSLYPLLHLSISVFFLSLSLSSPILLLQTLSVLLIPSISLAVSFFIIHPSHLPSSFASHLLSSSRYVSPSFRLRILFFHFSFPFCIILLLFYSVPCLYSSSFQSCLHFSFFF